MLRAVVALINAGKSRNIPIKIGVAKVARINERVLTRSRYSRFAMIQTL
jgi:hypothetical protein